MIIFRFLKKAWMGFAHVLGTVNTFILLFVIYVVGVGIYGLIYKPFKWLKAIKVKINEPDSYWSEYEQNNEYKYPF